MDTDDEPLRIVSAAPVEAADRMLIEWSTTLGVDPRNLSDHLVDDTRSGPTGKPLFRSYSLRRQKAAEVYAAAGKLLPITRSEFARRLAAAAPAVEHLLAEHLEDNDELLLHPFVARVRDLAIDAFERGDSDLSARIIGAFDAGLREGDADVENAVAVSFVEDTPLWEPARRAFIDSWPEALREEANRQRDGGP